jgi:hypothetical protein
MGQLGLHGLTSLVAGEYLLSRYVPHAATRRALLFGFTMGSLMPDLDFLAVVGQYPVDNALAMHLHRSFSHSLLAALTLWAGFWAVGLVMGDRYVSRLGHGLAVGVAAHFTADMFFWFAPVDIFWPASVYGWLAPIDLWWWYDTPVLAGRLMGAAELAAYALYYDHLIRLAIAFGTNREMIAPIRRLATVCWVTWVLLTALSFDVADPSWDLYLYLPIGIVFVPSCFYVTWRMQPTIELLAVFRQSPR